MSRKAKPNGFVHYFQCLQKVNKEQRGLVSTKQLEELLVTNFQYSKSAATEFVQNAMDDGFLVPVTIKGKAGPSVMRLIKASELQESTHDFYCFECYMPGDLVNCINCSRSFHSSCYRANPERPNLTLPERNLVAESHIEKNNGNRKTIANNKVSSRVNFCDSTATVAIAPNLSPRVRLVNFMRHPQALEIDAGWHRNVKEQTQSNNDSDVINACNACNDTNAADNSSVKDEMSDSNIFEELQQLCTCCRLYERRFLSEPPEFSSDERCYLLNYSFNSHRAWLKRDLPKFLECKRVSKKSISQLTGLLFKRPNLTTLATITGKIQNQEYDFLIGILIDILEMQFAIGVLFGGESTYLERSKYLYRDLLYDIHEIRCCKDCFRHSNEKITRIWFALPCLLRHELVFAKMNSYPYWPAKVIRVLSESKYDVRFFGGAHERSLIDESNIRAIDENVNSAKSISLKKPLIELQCYQMFTKYPIERFAYRANRDELQDIIETVETFIGRELKSRKFTSIRGRPRLSYNKATTNEYSAEINSQQSAALERMRPTEHNVSFEQRTVISTPSLSQKNTDIFEEHGHSQKNFDEQRKQNLTSDKPFHIRLPISNKTDSSNTSSDQQATVSPQSMIQEDTQIIGKHKSDQKNIHKRIKKIQYPGRRVRPRWTLLRKSPTNQNETKTVLRRIYPQQSSEILPSMSLNNVFNQRASISHQREDTEVSGGYESGSQQNYSQRSTASEITPRAATITNSAQQTSISPLSMCQEFSEISGSVTMEQYVTEIGVLQKVHQREIGDLQKVHQRELIIAKRKLYCSKCLAPAALVCCLRACYCSMACQRVHWFEEHSKICEKNSLASKSGSTQNGN